MNWEDLPPFTEIHKEFRGTRIEKIFDNEKSNEKIKKNLIILGAIILNRLERIFEYDGFKDKFGSNYSIVKFKQKYLFNFMNDICDNMKELNILLTEVFGSENIKLIFPKVLKYIIEGSNNFTRMEEINRKKKTNHER